jgi:hypothetical protein
MQPPGTPREREWSGRINFVREQRDANDEKLETKNLLALLAAAWRRGGKKNAAVREMLSGSRVGAAARFLLRDANTAHAISRGRRRT